MSKYEPFINYLISQPSEKSELSISFEEIERLLGTSLPPTARVDRPWWANTWRSNQGSRWLKGGWKVGSVNLKKEKVVFNRSGNVQLQEQTSSQGYENLIRFLKNVPTKQEQRALRFPELSGVIGKKLPATAFHDRPWWANTKASPQGSSWLSAGWLVEKVYLKGQFVVFRRKGLNPLRGIPAYVKQLLDGSSHLGQVDSRTLSNWISFCRKVGWFFEGTVLYERGGLALDSLSEVERVEVDEDYATCKREITQYQGMRA